MECFICNNLDNCPIYQNWVEQTKKDRLDMIYFVPNGKRSEEYKCLALDSLNDAETGIPKNKELTNRLKNEVYDCAFIESLNNQAQILKRLDELLSKIKWL